MSDFPVIELDYIDSTNNYAMQLIDANKALPGTTIVARQQGGGKGQRGRAWIDEPGQSLLMSIIVVPRRPLTEQFVFSASVAVAIANVLQKLSSSIPVYIKWPNDIIINDKKAGGILIENILRGSQWTHSIIGIGINVQQSQFSSSLPSATSLRIAFHKDVTISWLCDQVSREVQAAVAQVQPANRVMDEYNDVLYKRDRKQLVSQGTMDWTVTVLSVGADGRLEAKLQDGTKEYYQHGEVKWEY